MAAAPLTDAEIQALPLPPVNRFSYRVTRETLAVFAGLRDDDIDSEQRDHGGVLRFSLPLFHHRPAFAALARWMEKLIPGWNGEWVNVTRAELVRELYTMPPDAIDHEAAKAYGFRFMMGANSPFLLTGAEHTRARRALIPELSVERVEAHREMSVRVADRMIDELPVGSVTPMRPLFERFAQELIVRFVFGLDDDEQAEIDRLRDCLTRVMHFAFRSNTQIFTSNIVVASMRLPGTRTDGAPRIFRTASRLREEADAMLYAKLAELRAQPNDSAAARIAALGDEDPEFWTDKRLRDMLATLLIAGHDTSVNAYAWTAEFLLHNPAARERLVAEARAGDSDDYARACNSEAIRLKPPVWGQMAIPKRDIALGGYRVRKGTFMFMPGRAVHSDPELYPDPFAFRPERWLERSPDRFGYITFAAGRHRCPGTTFFGTEGSILLHRLFGRVQMHHPHHKLDRTHMKYGLFNRPASDIDVLITDRAPADSVPAFEPTTAEHNRLDLLVDELIPNADDSAAEEAGTEDGGAATCPFTGATA